MVSRDKLFVLLKHDGCGMLILAVLVAINSVTESVIGSSVMTTMFCLN